MITHYKGCNANYPEKNPKESPQALQRIEMDGHIIMQCVDCGAFSLEPINEKKKLDNVKR